MKDIKITRKKLRDDIAFVKDAFNQFIGGECDIEKFTTSLIAHDKVTEDRHDVISKFIVLCLKDLIIIGNHLFDKVKLPRKFKSEYEVQKAYRLCKSRINYIKYYQNNCMD